MNYITKEEFSSESSIPQNIVEDLLNNNLIKGALKEEGLLPEEYTSVTLKEKSERYPFLILTDMVNNPFNGSIKEIKLLLCQEELLKGNFDEAYKKGEALLADSEEESIKRGCYLVLCISSLYKGDLYHFRMNYKKLKESPSFNNEEHKEKELLIIKIRSNLYLQEMPEWINKGECDLLNKDALPHARNLFMFNHIKNAENVDISFFRFTLSETRIDNAPVADAYLSLLIGSACHYLGRMNEASKYINDALDILLPGGYLLPLLELRKSIGVILDQEIRARDEKLYKQYVAMHKSFMEGWDKVYEYYKGEYPTKYLNLREEEIMFYVMNGKSNQEIADILCLSVETIKTNLKNIFQKTGVEKRSDLKAYMEENA